MASITGPYVLDFTGAQEGFVPVYRDAQPNKIAWEEAPTGGGDEGGGATPAGGDGAVQFNDGGSALGGDETAFFWDVDTTRLRIGAPSAPVDADFGKQLGIELSGDEAVSLNVYASGANFPSVHFIGSRGTVAVPAVSHVDDVLGNLDFEGYDSAYYQIAAAIQAVVEDVDEAGGTGGFIAGSLRLKTASISSGNAVEALRINSNQSVLALWGLGPIAYFNDPATPMQAPIAAVDQMLLYGAGAAAPTFYFAYSDGSYASPTATPLNAVIGKIQFEGAGTDGTANSVNGQSAIIATNRSSDPDAIVADIDFFTAATELSVRYDGGIVLPHEFANGSDPAAPASGGRLYIVQTGGGKSQLAVRFPSGAAQIIATEP